MSPEWLADTTNIPDTAHGLDPLNVSDDTQEWTFSCCNRVWPLISDNYFLGIFHLLCKHFFFCLFFKGAGRSREVGVEVRNRSYNSTHSWFCTFFYQSSSEPRLIFFPTYPSLVLFARAQMYRTFLKHLYIFKQLTQCFELKNHGHLVGGELILLWILISLLEFSFLFGSKDWKQTVKDCGKMKDCCGILAPMLSGVDRSDKSTFLNVIFSML